MRIISRPKQLQVLSALSLLTIPLFVLNIWVMHKGSFIKVIQDDYLSWVGIQTIWALLIFTWVRRAHWAGFWLFLVLTGVLLVGNLYFLVQTKNYALAFYALFLMIMAILYLVNLIRVLKEPYYHSGKQWFEGTPRFLPRLEAELGVKDTKIPVRLSRLAVTGCFAYNGDLNKPQLKEVDQILLKLDDLVLNCGVELISTNKDGTGGGFRFLAHSSDQDKDIREFIDRVRSSGYVA